MLFVNYVYILHLLHSIFKNEETKKFFNENVIGLIKKRLNEKKKNEKYMKTANLRLINVKKIIMKQVFQLALSPHPSSPKNEFFFLVFISYFKLNTL